MRISWHFYVGCLYLHTASPQGDSPRGSGHLAICQKLRPTKCMRVFEPMTPRPHICGAFSGSKATVKAVPLLPTYPLFYLCTSKHREPKIAFGLRAQSSKDDSRFSATHPGPPRT